MQTLPLETWQGRKHLSNFSTLLHFIPKPKRTSLTCRASICFSHPKRFTQKPALISCASKRVVTANAGVDSEKRILLSDVVVKNGRRVYWGRKWRWNDIATAGVVVSMHVLCFFAPLAFNWGAFWVALALYFITGLLGITLCFHRNLSHRSFTLPKWLEYLFAYCGVQALQGNPLDWVSTHRYHHQYCDSERDPHSPKEGFWYSHVSWLFDTKSIIDRCGEASNVGDLEKQGFYRFLQQTYIVHPIALGVLLYAVGGFPFLVWGMVRNAAASMVELSSTDLQMGYHSCSRICSRCSESKTHFGVCHHKYGNTLLVY